MELTPYEPGGGNSNGADEQQEFEEYKKKKQQTKERRKKLPLIITIILTILCCGFTAAGVYMTRWSRIQSGTTTNAVGLWENCTTIEATGTTSTFQSELCADLNYPGGSSCKTYVMMSAATGIIACGFYVLVLLIALLVYFHKKPWKTRKLVAVAGCNALVGVLMSLFSWIFWMVSPFLLGISSMCHGPCSSYGYSYGHHEGKGSIHPVSMFHEVGDVWVGAISGPSSATYQKCMAVPLGWGHQAAPEITRKSPQIPERWMSPVE